MSEVRRLDDELVGRIRDLVHQAEAAGWDWNHGSTFQVLEELLPLVRDTPRLPVDIHAAVARGFQFGPVERTEIEAYARRLVIDYETSRSGAASVAYIEALESLLARSSEYSHQPLVLRQLAAIEHPRVVETARQIVTRVDAMVERHRANHSDAVDALYALDDKDEIVRGFDGHFMEGDVTRGCYELPGVVSLL